MRKAIAFGLMLMLCISLACPAFAAENGFVPSITYKGEPDIVPVEPGIIGVVREAESDSVISHIYEGCLRITPVSEAETSQQLSGEAAQTLLYVYEELVSGRMTLPYDKVPGCDGRNMVILELVDASWLCGDGESDHDHPTEVAPEGIVFDITFDLGVASDALVTVMTYKDGEWNPIEEVVNNGDGTVKCTFEKLCPVAFSVGKLAVESPKTVDSSIMPWMVVMIASLAALAVLFLSMRKKQAK